MPNEIYINFASPANQTVLAFLHIAEPEKAESYTEKEVHAAKLGMSLGTHPDLVDYLWHLMDSTDKASVKCACVINQRSSPLLVNPTSGIIFGLASGTSTVALRLPQPELSDALAVPKYGAEYHYPKSVIRAAEIGEDWALVKPFDKIVVEWCLRAFEYAGTLK